jgi:hypothetical protein
LLLRTKDGSTGKLQNHPAEAPFDVYESPFECLDKMMDLKQLTAAQDSSWKTDPLASAGFLPPATQGYNQSLLPKEYELTSVQGDNIGAKCDFEV